MRGSLLRTVGCKALSSQYVADGADKGDENKLLISQAPPHNHDLSIDTDACSYSSLAMVGSSGLMTAPGSRIS